MASSTSAKLGRNISVIAALILMTNSVFATSVALRNDINNAAIEAAHLDDTISHYKYEEELEHGEQKNEIEFESNESTHAEHDIIEQELDTINKKDIDTSSRTNFFSNDNGSHEVNVLEGVSEFNYLHQVPPSVSPGDPLFNTFDFTKDLFEFELEIEGWSTTNTSTYEVSIMMDEVFGIDVDNNQFLQTPGTTVAKLGELSFDYDKDKKRYEFEFEFEQYGNILGGGGISPEIYKALLDGFLGIKITRTSGAGDLFLTESELELEKPSVVPLPPAFVLFSSAFLFLWGSKKSFRKAS